MAGVIAPGKTGSQIEDVGLRLRKIRESLGLRFRDVEIASQKIADRYNNEEYSVVLSRLSDIENRNVVPSIYRLYSLATIYRIDFHELVGWYGVSPESQAADSQLFELEATHPIDFQTENLSPPQAPLALDPGLDLTKTTFLSRFILRWGTLPFQLFGATDLKKKRYGMVGSEDWSMYPILKPGSLLLLQETTKISSQPWGDEFERPIYLLMSRQGYHVGWCHLDRDCLILLSHPSANEPPRVFQYPRDVEILGQVIGVATGLESPKRRKPRASEL